MLCCAVPRHQPHLSSAPGLLVSPCFTWCLVAQLQSEVSHAAASALAVVQVQHEQHLLSVQQQQQEAVAEAKQQVASLQHHVQQLLQEQVGG